MILFSDLNNSSLHLEVINMALHFQIQINDRHL